MTEGAKKYIVGFLVGFSVGISTATIVFASKILYKIR